MKSTIQQNDCNNIYFSRWLFFVNNMYFVVTLSSDPLNDYEYYLEGLNLPNADGASWIKKVKDKSTCFQLDPFHRNKAVKEKIHEPAAQEECKQQKLKGGDYTSPFVIKIKALCY